MAKLHAARCPSCGANIQVPPHAPSVTCRYCSNVITVQHQKPPPAMHHMAGIPSTTLYIDPEEIAKAGRRVAYFVIGIVALTVVLPLVIGLVAWGGGRMKSKMKPFPIACAYGETVEVTGDWTGTGPVVEKVEYGCKIHIKQSKLKAPSLIKGSASNVEITLENVTLDTTETAIQGDGGMKIHLTGTTITSGDIAVKGTNLALDASASKITGKKAGLDLGPNAKLSFKNASELAATEGVALKTTSSLVLELDGGKIDGGESAIVATSGAKITGKNVIITSKSGEAIHVTSSMALDLDGGGITSGGDAAVQSDGGDFTLAGTKIQGTTAGLSGGNGLKLKATKKAAIVATSGDGIDITSNGNLVLVDATVEGSRTAIKSSVNLKVKPSQGARLTGKSGGIATGHNFELDANNATIEGGSGPGLVFDANARITMQQGVLKGAPAIKSTYKPQVLSLEGTKVEGEQQTSKR